MSATIEETFNPAALSNITPQATAKPTTNGAVKPPKTAQTFPRIDFELLYSDLKACIGHNWAIYHDALAHFIRGEINNREFGYLTDEFIYATPTSEHAHNSLICAIAFNTGRDSPEPGPAAWVSAASDKTSASSSSKPAITSDISEQRLKREVMALPARDRRRLKAMLTEKQDEEAVTARRNQYEENYNLSRIRAPESAPIAAGGLTRTNWELEIKKRYMQPLFAETLEFPDAPAILARMNPICYEESVAGGANSHCAELVVTAAEVYLKDFLGEILNRTRANGPRYENGAGGGVLTARYKRQILKEEELVKQGQLQRDREDGLLPTESVEAAKRRPIGVIDIQTAAKAGPDLWNGMRVMGTMVNEAATDGEYDEWKEAQESRTRFIKEEARNGVLHSNEHAMPGDDMDVDDDDFGWEGTGFGDNDVLGSLLDDCLAIRM